ncbi:MULTISPECIES: hypothetical protein [Flavobacteriaceae]|jgi:hypothetical protein|uniref:Uncharacterized protein n=1 Tax=Leeuwenhoekiella aequorea TaxID=283736 RepID=A0A4Q0PAA2_9FLAO|nr:MULTISPECIES: hypothetical protein [Flavobacteriaceae]AOE09532.1 hypothetical protein [uncultured bacterium]RXG22789.1 hypothetical protein DSM00_1892 [Leeuwenhoekiella aequorea]WSP35065.1 hypothetical protein VVL01_03115 [Croceibacter atlanticus]|tara:strand:+ start:2785 stop:3117 length:333 start_codon:yes stop_codon:yes gene_type:complete
MKSKIHEYQNKYLAMSKISKSIFAIAIASTFLVTSCRETKTENTDDHGHEHNEDGSHTEETIELEEFKVGTDSMETKTEEHGHDHDSEGNHTDDDSDTHKHDDESEHHDH